MKIKIQVDVDTEMAFEILLDAIEFNCIKDLEPENCYTAKIDEETRGLFCRDELVDERGELYDILMLLANQLYPNVENRHIYGDIDTYIKNRNEEIVDEIHYRDKW